MRLAMIGVFAAVLAAPAVAQTAPPQRIIGSITAFTAPTLTVITSKGETLAILLAPDAKVIANKRSTFNAIQQNDFVALTAVVGKDGKLKAKEVRQFPEPLRGVGEGLYPGDKTTETRINATVTEAATTVKGKGGTLKLSFHAAAANPLGICSGHAPAPGKGGCTGDAEILVTPATPVTNWVLGDPSWLATGKAVSLYTVMNSEGKLVTYGVVVEHDGIKPLP
jgi:hypothetical protein